jgi:hypothetical protein
MKRQLIVILGFIIPIHLNAGNDNYPAGARSSSLATASVSLTDIWSSFNNQAGLAWLKTPELGFHYENKFLVKEYALQAGAIALPFRPGTGSLNYRYFGYSKYHEAKIGLAFARKLHRSFSAGVQINYHQTFLAEGYGSYHAVTAELGVMYTPSENLFIGAHVFNPNRAKSNAIREEYIPTIFRIGAGYTILNKATLLFETEKNIDREPVFKGGLEITALKNLDFRFGFGSDYIEYTFGLGYHSRRFSFDLAFSHHYILGFTPHASFNVKLGRNHD